MSGKRHSDLQCSVKEGTGKTSLLPADRIALSLRKWIAEFILVIYLQIRVLFIWVHSIPCQLTLELRDLWLLMIWSQGIGPLKGRQVVKISKHLAIV